MEKIIETERLYLRRMHEGDFNHLCETLQDPEVMYAYEHAFSDAEVGEWLNKQMNRYREYGFGLWLMVNAETQEVVGQCGLTMQGVASQQEELEIGYLLNKRFWKYGYATEAAQACKEYAFNALKYDKVVSIIRENNFPSQRVAERIGMEREGRLLKHYHDMDMPHFVYAVYR